MASSSLHFGDLISRYSSQRAYLAHQQLAAHSSDKRVLDADDAEKEGLPLNTDEENVVIYTASRMPDEGDHHHQPNLNGLERAELDWLRKSSNHI